MFIRHAIGGGTEGVMYDAEGGSGGAGGGSGVPGADAGNAGGGAGVGTPWYAGKVDQEIVGHWQNKGWNVADPATVALEATRAWRSAEANLGVPADRLLRLPADRTNPAEMRSVWERLGAPADKAGYDFSNVKFSDGAELDGSFTQPLADTFHKLGIPKDAATEITRQVVGWVESVDKAEGAENGAKLQAEQQSLRQNWGQNYEANKFIASQAAQKLGMTPAELDMLDGQIGHARVMEMFRRIGTEMGEARFVTSMANGTPGVMTQEQAVARIADLKKDPAWTKKYLAGDTAARNEMAALQRMKLGPIDESMRPARNAR